MDDGDTVVVSEAEADALRRLPGNVHPVSVGHGARGVKHQGDVDGGGVVVHIRSLEGNTGQVQTAVQGMGDDVSG